MMSSTPALSTSSSTGISFSLSKRTGSSAASVPKLPSEITLCSVKEIIKEWNAELQARTGKFRKQATAIGERDWRILQNCDALLSMETEVANVVETKTNWERHLELIEIHQEDLLVFAFISMRSSQQVHRRKAVLPVYSRHHSQKKKLILVLTLHSSLELVEAPRLLFRDYRQLDDSSSPCVPGIKHTSACSSAPCMGRMASPVKM